LLIREPGSGSNAREGIPCGVKEVRRMGGFQGAARIANAGLSGNIVNERREVPFEAAKEQPRPEKNSVITLGGRPAPSLQKGRIQSSRGNRLSVHGVPEAPAGKKKETRSRCSGRKEKRKSEIFHQPAQLVSKYIHKGKNSFTRKTL